MKKNLMAACGVFCAVAMLAPAVGATEAPADGWKIGAGIVTNVEKAEDYGMRPASAIGKEWFEQAEAFSQFCIGKTVDEVAAIELEDGKPTDVDLVAGCTMSCGDMQAAVVKAINYATPAADGTVTGCYIDASQLHCGFNAAGEVNADMVVTDSKSKNELGEEYGMKPASSIGLEWNEQAAGFAQYATGKNIADLAGMELDAEGHAVDADALATATIHVNSWVAAFAKMQ